MLACMSTSGCTEDSVAILVNATAGPVEITYAREQPGANDGRQRSCELERAIPRVGAPDTRAAGDWSQAPAFSFDRRACEITYVLAPGEATIVEGGECDDDASRYSSNGRPKVRFLRMTSGNRLTEFSGWEVAEQFKRVESRRCQFTYR